MLNDRSGNRDGIECSNIVPTKLLKNMTSPKKKKKCSESARSLFAEIYFFNYYIMTDCTGILSL